MDIQEGVNLAGKTTLRIGGKARFYAELSTKEDVPAVHAFAQEHSVPLVMLGGGSNTAFADEEINALVVKITADETTVSGNTVTVQAGKILAVLINELAEQDLDLSPLTGIPGMVGGAIFGNAGQGPNGIWIDSYVDEVTAYIQGEWKTLTKADCEFRYRESYFKDICMSPSMTPISHSFTPIIWETVMTVPSKPATEVKVEVDRLLQKRIDTQPHLKTAGSCFKALPDGTPAWRLIDAAGLRGFQVGGIQISDKHANFLLNVEKGSFSDMTAVITEIKKAVPALTEVEMRIYDKNGELC